LVSLKDNEIITFPAQASARDEIRFVDASKKTIYPNQEPHEYLKLRLDTNHLDNVVDLLWLAGLRGKVRPLHRWIALNIRITITETARMHLLWRPSQIFLMPLEPALFNYATFKSVICNADATPAEKQHMYSAALGLLLTYTKLILYESDLRLAQHPDYGLLPAHITYKQWVAFSSAIIAHNQAHHSQLPGRYHYGELRLYRINLIYRFALRFRLRYVVHGYFEDTTDYSSFLEHNFRWLLVVFAYASIVLSAMQLGGATYRGKNPGPFQEAMFVIAMIAMGIAALGVLAMLIILGIILPQNLGFAWAHEWKVKREEMRAQKTVKEKA
jgi:hypothetical protein